ncbi:MAG: hypothetical protein HY216_04405, partial [Candidatus Rokubacteria bacterium]|nr:hypothetical protein [Candidatus Rokubacteria bacterium]
MKTHQRGFHARVADRPCARCHPDHGGRDFRLVVWDAGAPEKFVHRDAGWPLEGRHAALECRSCHKPEFQRSGAAALIRKKDRTQSWLGLETACASCHRDPHAGRLGADCTRCHTPLAWKPVTGFDHARTRYPLTGRHTAVACEKCHLSPALPLARDAKGAPVPIYSPLPHGECSDCHRDPHQNRFGAACASCHSTDSFHTIRREGFNHDRTRYPLRGRHASVECNACHDPKTAWGPKPAFATCGGCHRDAHGGLATIAGKPADCASCHRVEGFRPSTFTVAQHRASTYPLEGAHVAAECAGCHGKRPAGAASAALGTARVVMRLPHGACTDCHADPHG